MKKHIFIAAAGIFFVLLLGGCGSEAVTPETAVPETVIPETTASQKEDYSGRYVDTQGTTDIYSELELTYLEDGSYEVSIGLYRLAALQGTARAEGEILSFTDENMGVKGEITIQDTGAVFTVTESEFAYMQSGEMFTFPERR